MGVMKTLILHKSEWKRLRLEQQTPHLEAPLASGVVDVCAK